jgi:orotate phosphoribosyltransferase
MLIGQSFDRDALLDQVKKKAIVHGRVTLASGREADYYVDLRRITLDAEAAPLIGPALLELTSDLQYDAVGGLTLGADPQVVDQVPPYVWRDYAGIDPRQR